MKKWILLLSLLVAGGLHAQTLGTQVQLPSGAQSLTQILGPNFQSPWLTCVTNSLVCSLGTGTIYTPNGPVSIVPGSVTVTGSATTCARPGFTSCDFIYSNSSGTIATSQTLSTAAAAGDTILAYLTTSSSGVLTLVTPYMDTSGPPLTSTTDGYYWITCVGAGSANASAAAALTINPAAAGTGLVVQGTSLQVTQAYQVATTNTGTNTHQYDCPLLGGGAARITAGKGVAITSVAVFYGVQQASLGTQASTAASGTYNGTIVFNDIVLPTAGSAASTVTPVRLDSGTLGISPAAASAQVSTTSAGAFYNVTFTPASAIPLTTTLVDPKLSFTLQCTATTATTSNVLGAMVFFTSIP